MRIAVFAGPTGGHLFPALAFVEALKRKLPDSQVLLVTGERAGVILRPLPGRQAGEGPKNLDPCLAGRQASSAGACPEPEILRPFGAQDDRRRGGLRMTCEFLPDFPFPRPNGFGFIVRFPLFVVKLADAFRRSREILGRFRPDLCVGFGSYLSFPGLWLSRQRGIPVLIHEQNRRLGRANAWLARGASRIALSFEETEGIPAAAEKVCTGFPIRASLVEAASRKERESSGRRGAERLGILILGGSQGSRALNELWKRALGHFTREEKSRMAVIHITGEKDLQTIQAMYQSEGVEASVFPFHSRMEEIYSKVDLAFTRAGAGTLFELALFSLPAVVVPYPHAAGHQGENAEFFEREGAIRLLPESEADPLRLRNEVVGLMNSESLRAGLSNRLRCLVRPDAAERLVEAACGLLQEKESCLL